MSKADTRKDLIRAGTQRLLDVGWPDHRGYNDASKAIAREKAEEMFQGALEIMVSFVRGEYKARGQAGGVARAQSLSPKRRTEIARNAAKARWSGKRKLTSETCAERYRSMS